MEINKNNFKESLDLIDETIDSASFLAIDAEFTGLEAIGCAIHAFDTPEERYQKLIKSAKAFIIVQFGLAAFTYNETTKRYTVRIFNFYVFPRQHCKQAPDVRFSCQSSSLEFMASQGLDFAKVVQDGISYLLPADELRLLEALQTRHAQQAQYLMPTSDPEPPPPVRKSSTPLTREQKKFVDAALKQVNEFLIAHPDPADQGFLDLEPCSAFLRKSLFEAINQKFDKRVHVESKVYNPKQRCIRVCLPRTEDQLRCMELERQQAELQELDDAAGFSKVIKKISLSQKLVVGHNMILDLLHILDQFCFELPSDYEDFKSAVHCVFPRLCDTKHIASSPPFKDFISNTTLADLQKELEKSPFSKVEVDAEEGFPNYEGNAQLHEAGYDAYLTGLCFISMSDYLASKSHNSKHNLTSPDWPLLDPFKNRLHLMRISDIPFINLDGADLPSSREHIFHVTFTKDKKAADILDLFSPFGNIQIVWLNSTSAFAALYRKDLAEQARTALTTSRNGWCRVLTYAEYVSSVKNAGDPKCGRKRKLPSSDPGGLQRKKQSPTSVCGGITPIVEEDEPNNSMDVDPEAADIQVEDVNDEPDQPAPKKLREDTTSAVDKSKDDDKDKEDEWPGADSLDW